MTVREMEKPSQSEHLEYLEKIVRLKLFYLHFRLKRHPEESFRFVLRNRVDIYRKTALNTICGLCPAVDFEQPAWRAMENAAEQVYLHCGDDAEQFEREAFQVFRSSIEERAALDYRATWMKRESPCGSIVPEEKLQEDGKTLGFHIANSIAPRSFFQEPEFLHGCLLELVRYAEARHAEFLACSSWLNSHPRWLDCFPEEWTRGASLPESDVQWHYGFWGQFITARKTFHEKNAAYLRERREFRYPLRHCRCSLKSLKEFLS